MSSEDATSGTQTSEQTATVPTSTSTPTERQERRDERTRQRLTEVTSERDTLRARYDAMVAAEVSRLLATTLTDPPGAMRAAGVEPSEFVTDDGVVDADDVTAFAAEFVKAHPGFRRPTFATGNEQHRVKDSELANIRRGESWAEVLGRRAG
jgi:hypothetical protein